MVPSKSTNNESEYFGEQPVVVPVPKPVKPKSLFRTSYSIQDFPWDRLVFGLPKQSQKQKTAFFCSVRLDGAPMNYKLRLHMMKRNSMFGFSPPMEGAGQETGKYRFGVTVDDPLDERMLADADALLGPKLLQTFNKKGNTYTPMLKESDKKDSSGQRLYPPSFTGQVPTAVENDMSILPKTTIMIDGKASHDPQEWKSYEKKSHQADVLYELNSGWSASGKCGLKWTLVRHRPIEEMKQEALFPDEMSGEEDEIEDGSLSENSEQGSNQSESKGEKRKTVEDEPEHQQGDENNADEEGGNEEEKQHVSNKRFKV